MSKGGILLNLRLRLEEAITYGTKSQARRIALQGLRLAKKENLTGEVAYFQGQLELIAENYAGAIECFKVAVGHNPKDGAAYNDWALCLVELGFIDDALGYFEKGIEVEPDFATIYHNKGWLLNNIGRHTEAVSCFKKALSLEPNRAVTYDNLADALFNLGDYQGAVSAYQKVLELLKPNQCRGIRKAIRQQISFIRKKLKEGCCAGSYRKA